MYNEALFNAYEREHELMAQLERQDGDLEGLENYTRELEGAVEDLQFDVKNLKSDLDIAYGFAKTDIDYIVKLEEDTASLREQAELDLNTIKRLEDQVGDLDRERDDLRDAVLERDKALVRIANMVIELRAELADPKPIRTLSYSIPEDYLGEDPNPEFTSFLQALIFGGKL